ncbi:MAG TPA: NAD+ synthase, partial [Thermotogales bacterium]|nr:NAD+ synthase [Thermotogales bacterium]
MNRMFLRVSVAQLDSFVGDIDGNAEKVKYAMDVAEKRKSDILVLPELFITGYPPEDLVLRVSFLKANVNAVKDLIEYSKGKDLLTIVGFIDVDEDVYNAAVAFRNGRIVGIYRKRLLPNYSIFDERRYFNVGDEALVLKLGDAKIGITICEDLWSPAGPMMEEVFEGGAEVIVNLSASPYYCGKRELRKKYLSSRAFDYHTAIIYSNMIGGQDEIVFDGSSLIIDAEGRIIYEGKVFEEEIFTVDLNIDEGLRATLHDPRRRDWKYEGCKVRFEDAGVPRKDKTDRK